MPLTFNKLTLVIDAKGFATGTVYEGALGFVLQTTTPAGRHALKLPRLMADTDRENYYIAGVMDQEARNAALIRPIVGSEDTTAVPGIPGVLATLVEADALKQIFYGPNSQELALIVSFAKDSPPRFCLVTYDPLNKALTFEPNGTSVGEWLTPELWLSARDLFRGGPQAAGRACVTLRRSGAEILANGRGVTGDDTWFLGVPSPVYEWKTGTLEQAVRSNRRPAWTWTDHLNFCARMAGGLETLYAANFVHGDLRPANIMYEGDPGNWQNYCLIDYSSFSAITQAVQLPPTNEPDATVVGVPVAEARQSPFYPIERRVGREREDGDTVVIRRRDGYWFVHVGFRSQIFEKGKLSQGSEEAFSELNTMLKTGTMALPQSSPGQWLSGDRIRVRDFVFGVDAWHEGVSGNTYGGRGAWLVYNNRVLVPLDSADGDRVLSVSRTAPLWQWSMATDMYSLGVLLLYSWFYDPAGCLPESPREGIQDGAEGPRLRQDEMSPGWFARREDEFVAMIAAMSNPFYAREIIPEIAGIAALLRRLGFNQEFNRDTGGRLVRLRVVEKDGQLDIKEALDEPAVEETEAAEALLADQKTLLGRVYAAASLMTQSTPGLWRVLYSTGRNLAWFVCLVETAVGLMHRRDDVGNPEADKGVAAALDLKWMAQNRAEKPDFRKMEEVRNHFRDLLAVFPRFANGFVCNPRSILGYRPANEVVLRRQNNDLGDRLTEIFRVVENRRQIEEHKMNFFRDSDLLEDLKKIEADAKQPSGEMSRPS